MLVVTRAYSRRKRREKKREKIVRYQRVKIELESGETHDDGDVKSGDQDGLV